LIQKVNLRFLKEAQTLINQKNMKTIGTIEIALGKLHQISINQITTWQLINWVSRIKFQLKIHFNKKIINK